MPMTAQPHRVLVVDDHEDTADALSMLFRLLGHDARSAPGGRDALRSAREFDPELIVLDLQLPDISGYEVVHELRAEDRGDRFIAAVTGRADDGPRALEAGFDAYFVKPIDLSAIRELLVAAGARARGVN